MARQKSSYLTAAKVIAPLILTTTLLSQAAIHYLRAKEEITTPKTSVEQTVLNKTITLPRLSDSQRKLDEIADNMLEQAIDSPHGSEEIYTILDETPNLGHSKGERRNLMKVAQKHPLIMLTRLENVKDPELRAELKKTAEDTDHIMSNIRQTNGRDALFGFSIRNTSTSHKMEVLDAAEAHPDARQILMAIAAQDHSHYDHRMLFADDGWVAQKHNDAELIQDFTSRCIGEAPENVVSHHRLFQLKPIKFDSRAFYDGMRASATKNPGYHQRSNAFYKKIGVPDTAIQEMNDLALRTLDTLLMQNDQLRAQRSQGSAFVRTLNDNHNLPAKVRFASLEHMSAEGILQLIKFGEAEVFTSTFMGLADRLFAKMDERGIDMTSFLQKTELKEATEQTFITAVDYGKGQEFLARFPDDDSRKSFLDGIMTTMDDKLKEDFIAFNNLSSGSQAAASLYECIKKIQDPALKRHMEQHIVERFDATSESVVKGAYGLIISAYLTANPDKVESAPFTGHDTRKSYILPTTNMLDEHAVFVNGTFTQRIHFYDDQDGDTSFNHFLDQYKANGKVRAGWKIDEHKKFVVIKSTGRYPNGRCITMVANRPKNELDATDDIAAYIKSNNLAQTGEFHRGHSYHADNTAEAVTDGIQLIGDMGCGGYRRLTSYIAHAPNAHIFSTQQEATKFVNDPLHFLLNNELLEKGSVDWNRFWPEALSQIGDVRKQHYRSPSENSAVYFLQALQSIHGERQDLTTDMIPLPSRNEISALSLFDGNVLRR